MAEAASADLVARALRGKTSAAENVAGAGRTLADFLAQALRGVVGGMLPSTASPPGAAANALTGGAYGKVAPEHGGIYQDVSNIQTTRPGGIVPLPGQDPTLDIPFLLQPWYHGTPHAWEGPGAAPEKAIGKTFDLSKIGTGEGAQAYGWGAYATKEPNVAEGYRKNLTRDEYTLKGTPTKDLPDIHMRTAADALAATMDVHQLPPDRAWVKAMQMAEQELGWAETPEQIERATKIRDALRSIDPNDIGTVPGRIYKLEGPEDEELLHWDKPISEQPHILEKLPALGLESPLPGTTGKDLYHHLVLEEQRKLGINSDTVWPQGDAPRLAAERLRAAGIPGHLYIGDTSGVQNAVIYDPAKAPVVAAATSLAEALRKDPNFTK